jgi:hypothetical protein
MGRPPIGKVAMSGAERTRLYRLRRAASAPVTKRVTEQNAIDGHLLAGRRIVVLEEQIERSATRGVWTHAMLAEKRKMQERIATLEAARASTPKTVPPLADGGDTDLSWIEERAKAWCEGQRMYVAGVAFDGLDPSPEFTWGTRLNLIGLLVDALESERAMILLTARLIHSIKADDLLADLVKALKPAERERLAASLTLPTRQRLGRGRSTSTRIRARSANV